MLTAASQVMGPIECCQDDQVAYHLSHSIDDHDGMAFLTVIE